MTTPSQQHEQLRQALQGRMLSFEGIDGAGKSTHINALADALRARGVTVVLTREPGGTPLAEAIREWVLHQPMDPLTEATLIFAARSDHIERVIAPALARGDWVLCDRFTDATFAYQGHGRDFSIESLSKLEQLIQQNRRPSADSAQNLPLDALLEPDLTIWFDLDPAIAAKRLAGARVPDKFESQPEAFFAKVRHGYAARAQAQPDRFAVINADASREIVWERVLAAVDAVAWWPKREDAADAS